MAAPAPTSWAPTAIKNGVFSSPPLRRPTSSAPALHIHRNATKMWSSGSGLVVVPLSVQRVAARATASSSSPPSPVLPDALLFDCDGVLVDTEKDGHRISFNDTFAEKELGVIWDVDLYGELLKIGGGKERMTAYFNKTGWPSKAPSSEEERKEFIASLHKRKTELFMVLIEKKLLPLRPGVASSNSFKVRDLLEIIAGGDAEGPLMHWSFNTRRSGRKKYGNALLTLRALNHNDLIHSVSGNRVTKTSVEDTRRALHKKERQ